MIEEFELPDELISKIPGYIEYLSTRVEAFQDPQLLENLITELDRALATIESPQKVDNAAISGNCWIDISATIKENVIIEGPCIICKNAIVGPNSFIRPGTIVGPYSQIGFGVEIKASIIGKRTKIMHRAYVGNSIIEENCDISAGVVIASKRLDNRTINTWSKTSQPIKTNLLKLGALIGKNAKIGSGALIMPGTVIGNDVVIYPNALVTGFIKPGKTVQNSNYSQDTNVIESLKVLIDSFYKENDLFWKRNGLFVTISGALFALFTVFVKDGSSLANKLILCFFGFVISLAWFQVCRMSKYYCNRVSYDIDKLLRENYLYEFSFQSFDVSRKSDLYKFLKRPFWGFSASMGVLIVAFLSLLLWLFIGFSAIFL